MKLFTELIDFKLSCFIIQISTVVGDKNECFA